MTKILKDEVLKEFAPIGKYRIRLLAGKDGIRILDIREYVSADTFEGFTRRGIRIADLASMDSLRDVLTEILSTPPQPVEAP